MVKLLFPDICNVFLRFIYLAFKLIFTTLKTGTFMRRYPVLLCDVHQKAGDLVIVMSNQDLKASQILAKYRERWAIEELFRKDLLRKHEKRKDRV